MPAVILKCAGCQKKITTYLNVLSDVFGKYSKVLIHNREVEGYEFSETEMTGQPAYFCLRCWEDTE